MNDVSDTLSTHILIVDDELSVRQSLEEWFIEDGYTVSTAEHAAAALDAMQKSAVDVVLLDIKMPGMDGLTLQERIREFDTDVMIIIITAFASVDTAVRALKAGAFDYVTKPIDPDELSTVVRNAAQQRRLQKENAQLKSTVEQLHSVDAIIGESEKMLEVFDLVRTVAPTNSTVLIRGESGTGKELIARAIHANSGRRYFPIIPVNCGALHQDLLESELFGHEKGSFTGAQYRRKGKFEMANGGTLFLDEIGTLSLKTQIDLLRILETRQFQRVGGERTLSVDFRLICATNADLEQDVKEGRFREDLYYRINVFAITIPPLRERKDDIPLLARHFVRKYSALMNKAEKPISESAMNALRSHAWPGNVRELENAIERAMVVAQGPAVMPEDLPMLRAARETAASGGTLADIEREHIRVILNELNWNITKSAERLGIDRATLYNKIEKYGLQRPS